MKRFPLMSQLMDALVPPAPKFTPKMAAFAASTLVVVGAAAMVFAMRKDPPPPSPPTPEPGTTETLVNEINRLKRQIKELNVERTKLIEKLNNPPSDVIELRRQLQEKDEQILTLIERVDALSAPKVPKTKPERPLAPSQALLVMNSFDQADRSIDFCFKEWSERPDDYGNRQSEANVMVRMSVGPDGIAHSAVATGVTCAGASRAR
jgi:hypothetical protein